MNARQIRELVEKNGYCGIAPQSMFRDDLLVWNQNGLFVYDFGEGQWLSTREKSLGVVGSYKPLSRLELLTQTGLSERQARDMREAVVF